MDLKLVANLKFLETSLSSLTVSDINRFIKLTSLWIYCHETGGTFSQAL